MPSPSRRSTAKAPGGNDARPSAVLSELKLAQAIQALDTTWKRKKVNPEEIITGLPASPRLTKALREALSTLLEIAACFDEPELASKAALVTVCTARILGCLKRFVTGCADMEPPLGACCECKCEQRLVHLTLLNILFRMCREPEIACNVVKEDLHKFLVQMCTTSETQKPGLTAASNPRRESEAAGIGGFNPYDLMIIIDPFDWCYQPLCTRLMKEKTAEFFVPMGIRSLICLLRGIAIPTDEVSEFEQQIHVKRGVQERSPRRRKLPSLFAFQHTDTVESAEVPKCRLAPPCLEDTSTRLEQHETRALWSLVPNDRSRVHLALRCLIALAIHLPKPSLEYKALLLERDRVRRVLTSICSTPGSHETDSVVPLPFQLVAIHPSTLKRIASAALVVFAEEQHVDPTSALPKKRVNAGERRTLCPLTSKKHEFTAGSKQRKECKPLSIRHRLSAATCAASAEFSRWEKEQTFHHPSPELERTRRRLAIRQTCADVESLRNHLIASLGVLCSGRQHPDPEQPFSEWIKSLPTLETLEQERQYQQEMRQRQILEQQYHREALRRRERDECTHMHANDSNVPKESELSVQQEKYERFLRMRAEIRELQQGNSDDKGKTEEKMPERQRLVHLEAQRREGRELEKMRREDLYYVERILAAKARAQEEQEEQRKRGALEKPALEEQQKHITRMRLLDGDKRLAEREASAMRVEELFGRLLRFREAEKAKEELHIEWRERKAMQAEEQDCRSRWTLWARALVQQQQEDFKQQRVQARRLKRQQEREETQIRAAWVASWDENGNLYYYNTLTGVSQWEAPG